MSNLTLILLSAGSSSRFAQDVKKQWLRIGNKPLWQFVADNFKNKSFFSKIIIVAPKEDLEFMQLYGEYDFVAGGNTRQQSLKNALHKVHTQYTLVSDIARACIGDELLNEILSLQGCSDCVVPALPLTDTIVYQDETINRDDVKRVQTPQLSLTQTLIAALNTDIEFTDESSAIVANGGTREFVDGDEDAHKITYPQDLNKLPCLEAPSEDILSGSGFDVHSFEDGKEMVLGGVKIDSPFGFKAHSDGDVALHALIDALLGASGLGDIGMLFPDSDEEYKNIDSKELLQRVVTKIYNFGFEIINVDITIMAEVPKLKDYKLRMRRVVAKILQIDDARVNIKATTTEKLGFIGRKEGVGVLANANLKYFNWKRI